MPDHFDDWLGTLDGEEYIKWGDFYGQKMHIAGSREIIAELSTPKMDEASAESQADRDAEEKELLEEQQDAPSPIG